MRHRLIAPLFVSLATTSALGAQVRPETGYEFTWDELRAMDEFTYPNRWDDLSLLNECYWLTSEEFTEALQPSGEIETVAEPGECFFWMRTGTGERFLMMRLTLEVYDEEANALSEGEIHETMASQGGRFYDELETGIADLKAYVRKDRGWIYVFPQGGVSRWRISYPRNLDDSIQYYADGFQGEDPHRVHGERFLRQILEKFDGLLS